MDLIVYRGFGEKTPPKKDRHGSEYPNWQPKTYYLSGLPTSEEVDFAIKTMNEGNGVALQMIIGIALLHPNDDFVRKIGREKAKGNGRNVMLTIDTISIKLNTRYVTAKNDEYTVVLEYPKGKGPRFVTMHYPFKGAVFK